MGASKLHELGITGDMAMELDEACMKDVGLTSFEVGRVKFTLSMLQTPGGLDALSHLDEEDCAVCNCCTVSSTINLMKERSIKINADVLKRNSWIAPYLIYAPL